MTVGFAAAAALIGSFMLGLLARPVWTCAVLPALWIVGAVALAAATGGFVSLRDWFAVASGAVVLLLFWVVGRKRRA